MTGVQTCALPIYIGEFADALGDLFGRLRHFAMDISRGVRGGRRCGGVGAAGHVGDPSRDRRDTAAVVDHPGRSEERRVGSGCRTRWLPGHSKTKQ